MAGQKGDEKGGWTDNGWEGVPAPRMTITELKETNQIYQDNQEEWLFRGKAFKGGKAFLEEVIFQHTREEDDAYKQRLSESYNYNFCATIVNLLSHFLSSTPPGRELGRLGEREDWKEFNNNVDAKNTNFNVFMHETQKLASVYSTAGILCDKIGGVHKKGDQSIYPYLSSYSPLNILDWGFTRIPMTNSYELYFVKLKDSFNSYIWWDKKKWERYVVGTGQFRSGAGEGTTTGRVNFIEEFETGPNPLGIVPFVFLPNIKDIEIDYIGQSDITDVAYINASMCRNLSECEMSLKYSAFPMLLMPAETANVETDHADSDSEVTLGREAVLSYDPEYNAKPAWLESPVGETVKGTIDWLDFKIEETYRACLLSSLAAQKDKAQTKSAKAIRAEQAVLNAILSKKADNMLEAERQLVKFFTMWQSCEDLYEGYHTSKTLQFNIEDMTTEIENSLLAIKNLPSETFAKAVYKKIANSILPNIAVSDFAKIEKEIEQNTKLQDSVMNATEIAVVEEVESGSDKGIGQEIVSGLKT